MASFCQTIITLSPLAAPIMLNLPIVVLVLGICFSAVFVWLMLTEWSYLGTGFVRRSYDWLSPWYEGKWSSDEYQSEELNQRLFLSPILQQTGSDENARVLDLACGTGRLSLSLLRSAKFQGSIHAVDFSPKMMDIFRNHLYEETDLTNRVTLEEADLGKWNADVSHSYDAVLLLEASELIPDLPRLMKQIAASLKPGGLLVTTQVGQQFAWLFQGRFQKPGATHDLLRDSGFESIQVEPWRKRYDVVLAKRSEQL